MLSLLQNQTSNLNWPPSSGLSNVIYASSRNSLTYNNLLAQGKICNIKTCFLEHTNPRVWLLEFTLNTRYSSNNSRGRDRRSGTRCLVCDLSLRCSSLEAELSLQRENEQGQESCNLFCSSRMFCALQSARQDEGDAYMPTPVWGQVII